MKKRIDIDEITALKEKNNHKKSKPIDLKHIFGISVIFFVVLIIAFIKAEGFTPNQATIIGVAGASAVSLFVLVITLDKESRDEYKEAKISAKILCQILDSTYSQIEKVHNGWEQPISYPSSWMDYYKKCCSFLEYDYLEYLLREFEIVEKINAALKLADKKEVNNIIEYRRKSIADWGLNFDILSVKFNLGCFVSGTKEREPWILDGRFKEFKKYFLETYTNKVKELTVEFLRTNSGASDSSLAEYYVIGELRKILGENDEKYKFDFMENKKVLHCISAIYRSLKSEDDFSLCWGELTLKKESEGNN